MLEKLSPKEFWKFIDETEARLKAWVLKNKADINYECCGLASDILYRILVDWKIHERCGEKDINDVIRISCIRVRGNRHDVVTILKDWIYDPTSMQFTPPLTEMEYSAGWLYDDCDYDCKKVFQNAEVLKVCRNIRPEVYFKASGMR